MQVLRPQCILSLVAFGKVCIYEIIPDLKNVTVLCLVLK